MISGVDKVFRQTTAKIPTLVLTKLLREKLVTAGMKHPGRLPAKLAEQLLDGRTESITIGDDNISIDLKEEDIIELESRVDKIIAEMPETLTKSIKTAARKFATTLIDSYDGHLRQQGRDFENFRNRLEDRWGPALDGLRLLLQINLEFGHEYRIRLARSKATKNLNKRNILLALHTRSCQVLKEIITLLENGLADGAMARWRTLHEIIVVAYVIDDGNDELAERYINYEIVEAKKALDVYENVYADLGYAKPSIRAKRRTNKLFDEIIKRYGPEFKSDFGWAAVYLGNKSPRFSDLERAAGRSRMRSHYKMASFKVHASPKGLTDHLCLLDRRASPIAGASNAGLEEPGQNAAICATQWIPLIVSKQGRLDRAFEVSIASEILDKTIEQFAATAKNLRREHEKIRSVLKVQFPDENPEIVWA